MFKDHVLVMSAPTCFRSEEIIVNLPGKLFAKAVSVLEEAQPSQVNSGS